MADSPSPDSAISPFAAELYLALGKAMSVWAVIENELCTWFIDMTGIDQDLGNDLFFTMSNFNQRMDLLLAAHSHWKESDEHLEFAAELFRKAAAYSNFRNRLAHSSRPYALKMGEPWRVIEPFGGFNQQKFDEGLTAQHMEKAAENFGKLFEAMLSGRLQIVMPAQLRPIGLASISELLARVRLLPNDAESSEPSQKQLAREKQRLAALGKLPGKKNTRRGQ